MHVAIIHLKRVLEPISLEEIQDYKVDADYLMEDGISHPFIDYIGDEYEVLDAAALSSTYNSTVFELIQKDEKYNLNHVYKLRFGAFRDVAKIKLGVVKEFIKSPDALDFKQYYRLKSIIVNPVDYFIYMDGSIQLIDDWLMNQAKEGGKYQIIQVFDSHL